MESNFIVFLTKVFDSSLQESVFRACLFDRLFTDSVNYLFYYRIRKEKN